MNNTIAPSENKLLRRYFIRKKYAAYRKEFLENCEKGALLNPSEVIEQLVNSAVCECGVSKTRRTIYYDLAWAVMENRSEVWLDGRDASGYIPFDAYLKEYLPEQMAILDRYDVAVLEEEDYFMCGIEMINDGEVDDVPGFCYALHLTLKGFYMIE